MKKKDDWECKNCGFNNFARNVECYRCKAPKLTVSTAERLVSESSSSSQQLPPQVAASKHAETKKVVEFPVSEPSSSSQSSQQQARKKPKVQIRIEYFL